MKLILTIAALLPLTLAGPAPPYTSTYTASQYPKITCGGYVPSNKRVYCPAGQICTIPPDSVCYNGTVTDCTGICVGAPCGGYRAVPYPSCPSDQTCARRPDQPDDDQVADLSGICVFKQATCGGKKGGTCPSGWKCVDNPDDSCFPNQGGKDCGGICSFDEGVSGNAGGDPR
ncbi:hypothetical protein NA57DRAFT_72954 [Rhizodiscina lignyota]|uniref:Uncharacterized protein n=1 Tax=Rhizodiscina lignyota TaxID=1504668 RepID=A0A9P4MDC6_9PEZI|nr:hypothetical protein NA57DRAFT_72954 [Rhizodiscina lignyota]